MSLGARLERLRREGQREPASGDGGRTGVRALGDAAGARARPPARRGAARPRAALIRSEPVFPVVATPLLSRDGREAIVAAYARSGSRSASGVRRPGASSRAWRPFPGRRSAGPRSRLPGQPPGAARPDARREARLPDPVPARALGLPERGRRAAPPPLRGADDPRLPGAAPPARPGDARVDLRAEHRHRRGARARHRLQPAARLPLPGGARPTRARARGGPGDARDSRPDGRVQLGHGRRRDRDAGRVPARLHALDGDCGRARRAARRADRAHGAAGALRPARPAGRRALAGRWRRAPSGRHRARRAAGTGSRMG